MLRLAVDIGGTFTDAVVLDEETQTVSLSKVPSTPPIYSDGVIMSIKRILSSMDGVDLFAHGTTVGTNALIQGAGEKTGLLTTKGFEDILEIGRGNRVQIYDPLYKPPSPLITRDKRLGIAERIAFDGNILVRINLDQSNEQIRRLAAFGVESVAICLINSYANSQHEERLQELVRQAIPGKYVSRSTEISREYTEYERTSTAVVNATLLPIMDRYLGALEGQVTQLGYRNRIMLMQSNGGVMTSTLARQKPIHTINSGLVGGVIAVRTLSSILGMKDMIGADMGGTSFDVELVVNGEYETTPMMKVKTPSSGFDGYPIQIPAVDIHAIGAGGGSIAWVDQGGALHVGPMSAAADPGPACFGKGGNKPTVTDANLVLERLNKSYFLGGDMKVFPELSSKVIKEIAQQLGMSLHEVAEGILRIVVTNMAGAIRTMTIRRGIDPREFWMVSFGGAGPLHAALIARELQIPKIIVSTMPGNFSAWGMLMTDLRRDYVQTHISPLETISPIGLSKGFERMEEEASDVLRREGMPPDRSSLIRGVDVRYQGQGHSISVTVPAGELHDSDIKRIGDVFDQQHLARYLHNAPGEPKEVVALRLTAIGAMKKAVLPRVKAGNEKPSGDAVKGSRDVYVDGSFRRHTIYDRARLLANNLVHGPAVIEETVSTTLLLEGQELKVDEYGHLAITEQ